MCKMFFNDLKRKGLESNALNRKKTVSDSGQPPQSICKAAVK